MQYQIIPIFPNSQEPHDLFDYFKELGIFSPLGSEGRGGSSQGAADGGREGGEAEEIGRTTREEEGRERGARKSR